MPMRLEPLCAAASRLARAVADVLSSGMQLLALSSIIIFNLRTPFFLRASCVMCVFAAIWLRVFVMRMVL